MQAAFEKLRGVVEHPWAGGWCAAAGAVAAAAAHQAGYALMVGVAVSLLCYALDSACGLLRAWCGIGIVWDKAKLRGGFVKFIAYGLFMILVLACGVMLDATVGSQDLVTMNVLGTAAAGAIICAEGLSALDHIDALLGGKLQLTSLRGVLKRIRRESAALLVSEAARESS